MSWRSWIGQKFGLTGERAEKFFAHYFGGKGVPPVSVERAMTSSAFFRGVRLKAETIATLPVSTYRSDPQTGRGVIDRGNEYDILARVSPNDHQTPVEFWEGMVAAEQVVGNGYALKKRSGRRVVALEPLDATPGVTYPFRNSQNQLRYRARDLYDHVHEDLAPEDVFHLKGFGFGGDAGLSVISYGAQSFNLALSAQKTATQTFLNGMSGNGFLETNVVLNETDRDRLQKIMERYQGDDSLGKLMILEGGMKYNRLSMTALDAQLLQTMGFSIEEIGRWLGMPPILLGHSGQNQTMWGTGVEAIIQAWYNLGLRADITRIEKAFLKRVVDPADQGKFYLKFNVNGILRGDTQTRALVEATQAQNGLRTRDELRENDDLGPIPGGDVATAQTNLAPLDQLGQAQAQGGPQDPMRAAVKNIVEEILAGRSAEDQLRARINKLAA